MVMPAIALLLLASPSISGQARTSSAPSRSAGTKKPYQVPKTPWGEPDLQGVWGGRHQTTTSLERPAALAGREFLTDKEIAAIQKTEDDQQAQKDALVKAGKGEELGLTGKKASQDATITGYEYNTFWVDTGTPAKVFRRTSLILEPKDGKLPYTPEARKRQDFHVAVVSSVPPADFVNRTWRDRDTGERCITDGVAGSLWMGTGPTEIIQGPGYVVILGEQFRDRRIIPTDGRRHADVHGWAGDARGHWEGSTLVIDTTNFADKLQEMWQDYWRAATSTTHLVERFTRVDADTIDYELTLTDPSTLTAPLKIAFPFMKSPTEQGFYEYACHEGNYGMVHLLSEARNLEKEEAAKKGK
jgi:hypothetical protein